MCEPRSPPPSIVGPPTLDLKILKSNVDIVFHLCNNYLCLFIDAWESNSNLNEFFSNKETQTATLIMTNNETQTDDKEILNYFSIKETENDTTRKQLHVRSKGVQHNTITLAHKDAACSPC